MTHTERVRGQQWWLTCLFGNPKNLEWKNFCDKHYGGEDPVIEQYFLPKITLWGRIRAFFLRPYYRLRRYYEKTISR